MGETLIRVTDLTYEDENDLVVKMVGRTADGRRMAKRIHNTEPYLFVPEAAPPPESFEDCDDIIQDVRGGFESYDGEALLQVVVRYPKDVRTVRDHYDKSERYESDVVYERRCTADYSLSGYVRVPEDASFHISEVESVDTESVDEPIRPRICYIDIEAEAPDQFYDDFAEEAPNEIQALTAYDSYDEEYTLFCLDPDRQVDPGKIRGYIEDHWASSNHAEEYAGAPITFKRFGTETSLLKDFIHYIQEKRPDVTTGWNYVDFDHEYIVTRIKANEDLNEHALSDIGIVGGWKTERYIPGLPAVDMMAAMQKILYGQRESWSLEYIANDELGIGKVSAEGNSYDENRSMFMAYNVVDTQLCVALDDVQGIFEFWYQLADICSIPPYSVGSEMKEVEGFLFKHRDPDEILPDTPEGRELDDISGGFVMPPSDGISDGVGVTDLKSLYPSSIITCNISEETKVDDPAEVDIVVPDMPLNYEEVDGDEITEDDIGWDIENGAHGFTLDQEGILPKYIKLLFDERRKKKMLRDQHDPGTVAYARYDLQQRAVKVIMNCFTEDTEVVTPRGVRDIADIEIGDEVYSINPDTLKLEVKEVVDTTHSPNLMNEVYNIGGKSIDLSVTPNHRMFVSKNGEPPEFVEAQDLHDTVRYRIPSHSVTDETGGSDWDWVVDGGLEGRVWMDYDTHGRTFKSGLPQDVQEEVVLDKNRGQYRISSSTYREHADTLKEAASEVVFQSDRKHGSFPISADTQAIAELLGWYITEGHIRVNPNPSGGTSATISIAQYGDTSSIEECFDWLELKYSTDRNGVHVCNRALAEWLKGVCGNGSEYKGIPEFVFGWSFSQKETLLQTLVDGDGTRQGEAIRYTTNSDQLRDDVIRLAVECGYKPDYSLQESPDGYRDVWQVYISEGGDTFSLDRNGEIEDHDEDVYCITVEDNHTVLAGRNGKFQWVGQSFFGVSDNDYFRLSGDGMGDSITGASRFVQWYGVQRIEEQGYDVIYGDTDSLMLELVDADEEFVADEVIQRGKELDANLVELMSPIADEFGIPDDHPFVDVDELPHDRLPSDENHLWQYEFEKLYRRFFQPGSKKRYAGWIVWKEGKRVDKVDTVGMESQRSDSPALAKKVQMKFIELVLKSESFEDLSEFVQERVDGIRSLVYGVDDIGVPSTINKDIEKYPNGPMPRGVRHVNEYVSEYDWSVGDDPWLVYVDGVPQGVGSTDVLALPWTATELPRGYELDVEKHVEKAVEQPIRAIVAETEYTWSELKTGKNEQSVLGGSGGGGTPDFGESSVEEPDFGDDDDGPTTQNSAFDW